MKYQNETWKLQRVFKQVTDRLKTHKNNNKKNELENIEFSS